jgi:xylulokinase
VHADVWDRTLLRVEHPREANARGAAFLAALGLGRLTVPQLSALAQVERTFTPRAEHRPVYDELFAEFVDLARRLKPFYRQRAARRRDSSTRD